MRSNQTHDSKYSDSFADVPASSSLHAALRPCVASRSILTPLNPFTSPTSPHPTPLASPSVLQNQSELQTTLNNVNKNFLQYLEDGAGSRLEE